MDFTKTLQRNEINLPVHNSPGTDSFYIGKIFKATGNHFQILCYSIKPIYEISLPPLLRLFPETDAMP